MVFYSATLIENEDGNRIMLHASKPTQREALAKQLLTPSADGKLGSKKVKLKGNWEDTIYACSWACKKSCVLEWLHRLSYLVIEYHGQYMYVFFLDQP